MTVEVRDTIVDAETLTNAGERMVEGNMWGYWAHLSIYHFAVPFAAGRRVLDLGSGAGYGAAHLARHGAHVLALDAGEIAIAHSRTRYAGDPVTFEVADLNEPLPLGTALFDVVFSSNVFEHVGHVDRLAAECARVVRPDGVAIVAVPPVLSAEAMASDMTNPFHVHHIPPTAWQAKFERFFDHVRCHAHHGTGRFASPEVERAELHLSPDQVTIRETDFAFPAMSAAEMMTRGRSITAVFVCRAPRAAARPETIAERTPADWREGEVAARLIGATRHVTPAGDTASGTRQAEAENQELRAAMALLQQSRSWRLTAPIRAASNLVRGLTPDRGRLRPTPGVRRRPE